jgi:hypothetical protein
VILTIDNQPVQVEFPEDIENLARIVADEKKILQILQEFRGSNLYFPQKVNRVIEHQRIISDYRGLTELPNVTNAKVYQILAVRYGKSPRWIREIVMRGTAA